MREKLITVGPLEPREMFELADRFGFYKEKTNVTFRDNFHL
jgi:hypothetical protein